MLTVRDPWEWVVSRATHDYAQPAVPCGCQVHGPPQNLLPHQLPYVVEGCNDASPSLTEVNASALAALVNDAWATCLVTARHRQPLLLLNVFNDMARTFGKSSLDVDGEHDAESPLSWQQATYDGSVEPLFGFLNRTRLKGNLTLDQVRSVMLTDACSVV